MRQAREITLSELVLGSVLALAVGVFLGAVTTFKHRYGLSGTPSLPIGLVLGLVLILAAVLTIRVVTGTRLFAAVAAIGVIGVVLLLSLPGPGGSVVIVGDVAGQVWTIAPTVGCLLVVAVPLPRRRPRADGILEP